MENTKNNVKNVVGAPFHYEIAREMISLLISNLNDDILRDIFRCLPIGHAAHVAAGT
jgi:hypothetical protein